MSRLYCDKCKRSHSGPNKHWAETRWLLTEQGMDVVAWIRLRESWSEAAVANGAYLAHIWGEVGGSGSLTPGFRRVLDGG